MNYCKKLLTNRPPKEDYINDIFMKEIIHENRMKESVQGDIEELTEDMFMNSWNHIKKTKSEKYKFLFGGGDVIRRVCLNICKTVWRTEIYPTRWNTATLDQLDKETLSSNSLE